jgi:peptidoglycan/LPS O-acetylase OafA/YrhL
MAALFVILLHYHIFIAKLAPDGTTRLFDKLYLMVDLFFVLSGFIMYHVYGQRFTGAVAGKDFLAFMKARFARIYPLHAVTFLFVLTLPLLLSLTGTPPPAFLKILFDYSAVPSQLLLTHAMGTHPDTTWNAASWSISVEWWAYVVFPFLVLGLVRTGTWSRYAMVTFIIAGYALITYYAQPLYWAARWARMNVPAGVPIPPPNLDVITGPFAFLRCICGFLFGMLVYECYRKGWGKRPLSSGLVFWGTWIVLLGAWHAGAMPDFAGVAGFGLVILSASHNTRG